MSAVEARREDVITAALGVAQARQYVDTHPEDGTGSWSLEAAEEALDVYLRRYMDARVARRRPALAASPPTLREACRAAVERERLAREKAAADARHRLHLEEALRRAARQVCTTPACYCTGRAHP